MSKEQNNTPEHQFIIQRFYTKDISFEGPNSPNIFTADWQPDMNLDIATDASNIGDDNYEVVLLLTVTVKSKDETAFLVELQQAGIFTISGFSNEELEHTLHCFCASNLYPYAREVVTDLVMKGGFPQLLLPPVNFEAIFEAKKAQGAEASPIATH